MRKDHRPDQPIFDAIEQRSERDPSENIGSEKDAAK